MDEFDNGGEIDVFVTTIGKYPGAQQYQRGPQPLAATVHNVMAALIDQGDIGVQALLDQFIDLDHVGADRVADGINIHDIAYGGVVA